MYLRGNSGKVYLPAVNLVDARTHTLAPPISRGNFTMMGV